MTIGPAEQRDLPVVRQLLNAHSQPGGRSRNVRWHHATSCHRPNFQPIERNVPIGTNPIAAWSLALGSFGSVIPANAVQNPFSASVGNRTSYRARPMPLRWWLRSTYAETSTDHW